MKNKVLLFFLPDLQIYPFSRGMAAFADAMQRYNKTAYLTGCTGEFTRCPVMDMYKIPSCEVNKKKKILCPICINMANKFNESGYDIPNIIFWNVNSRSNVFHADAHRKGVQICSGQSTTVFKQLIGCIGFTPVEMMKKVLCSERYENISIIGEE